MLKGKTILLGVTGSIAAYKACEIISEFKKLSAEIYVVMTKSATKFITPLTLQTLSGNPVRVELFNEEKDATVIHISLAKIPDLILIAPATANIIGKMASGIADDLLSTILLATKVPTFIAPAMNVQMYENKVVQENINKLKKRGIKIILPEEGMLACGMEGKGRLAEVKKIKKEVINFFNKVLDFSSYKILITAGATQEPIDPVRYITNSSSGKMGYALAKRAHERGAEVFLISGPTHLEPPAGVKFELVRTAEEMKKKVFEYYPQTDIVIKAAAVLDYKPKNFIPHKIKKSGKDLILRLEENPDILQELGRNKENKVLIGFAVETEDLIKNAKIKLKKKNLDMIVANELSSESGMGTDTNIAQIIFKSGKVKRLPKMLKEDLADEILDSIKEILNKERSEN